MEILRGLEGLRRVGAGAVLSVGNFDGVHRGHREILRRGRELALAGGRLGVVTFEPHPLTVLRPESAPPRLTSSVVKERVLAELGVDVLVVLPPVREVLDLTAEAFWGILRDEARPRWLVEGGEFNFGKGRGGTIGKLREWVKGTSVGLEVVAEVKVVLLDLSVAGVSSTLVRWLIGHGRVRDAGICLGRAYELEGVVVVGYKRGKAIGVPTANMECGDQLVPADGVYAGRCEVGGVVYPAAVSVGTMPTFGEGKRQVEAHLVGFDGDLYGRVIRVEVADWLRDQWKFPDVEGLKRRMGRDIGETVGRSGMDPAREVVRIGQGA